MGRQKENAAGLLLAAGASTRMGRVKQLLPIGGRTLLEKALKEALGSDLNRVGLVLGHEKNLLLPVVSRYLYDPRLEVIENPDYRKGMSTSIQAGLGRMEGRFSHLMILLADMPHVGSTAINKVLHAYLECRLPLAALWSGGRRSHPVIINSELFGELRELKGDTGARALFERHKDRVLHVDPPAGFDDRDIDTEGDYETLEGPFPLPGDQA